MRLRKSLRLPSLRLLLAIVGMCGAFWAMTSAATAQTISSQQANSERVATSQDNVPTLRTELESRDDALSFDQFVQRSTLECEAFRQRLLTGHDNQPSIETIIAACVEFNKQAQPLLIGKASIENFSLDPKTLIQRVKGDKKTLELAPDTYAAFAGKWFGRWDGSDVDHHWDRYQTQVPPLEISDGTEPGSILLGFQYAWVGDGYALNHLAKDDKSNPHRAAYLLGYVIHLNEKNLLDETARRPHVGIIDGPDRLIWITADEVFLEEVIRDANGVESKYSITGFRYEADPKHAGRLIAQQGFQAIYARDDSSPRTPWFPFSIDISQVP